MDDRGKGTSDWDKLCVNGETAVGSGTTTMDIVPHHNINHNHSSVPEDGNAEQFSKQSESNFVAPPIFIKQEDNTDDSPEVSALSFDVKLNGMPVVYGQNTVKSLAEIPASQTGEYNCSEDNFLVDPLIVKDEPIDDPLDLGDNPNLYGQGESPQELTVDDVVVEKIADVVELKSKLTYDVVQDNLTCLGCRKRFLNYYNFKKHLRICRKLNLVKFKCFHCSYEVKMKRNLEAHIKWAHPTGPIESPSCTKCGKTYMHRGQLECHLRKCRKSNFDGVKHKCKLCDYGSKRMDGLRRHMRRVHTVGQKERPTCPACRKSFKNEDSLKDHLRICEKWNPDVIKYKCQFCDYQSTRLDTLAKHIKTKHPVELEENVSGCSKTSINKNSLKKHTRPTCRKLNEKKFKCFHCSREINLKSDLIKHITRVHPIGPIDRPVCSGCGNSYKHMDGLRGHQRICRKSNTKKFKCFYCHHKTNGMGYLKIHTARVHPTGSINCCACAECGQSFMNYNALEQHSRICGKSKPSEI